MTALFTHDLDGANAAAASLPVALIATDAQGRVTHWSTHATELYGWTPEETIGRPVRVTGTAVPHPDGGDGLLRVCAKHGGARDVRVVEVPVLDGDGAQVGACSLSVEAGQAIPALPAVADVTPPDPGCELAEVGTMLLGLAERARERSDDAFMLEIAARRLAAVLDRIEGPRGPVPGNPGSDRHGDTVARAIAELVERHSAELEALAAAGPAHVAEFPAPLLRAHSMWQLLDVFASWQGGSADLLLLRHLSPERLAFARETLFPV